MTKLLFGILLSFSFVVYGCNDSISELLIGKWQEKEYSHHKYSKECDYKGYIEFKKGGTAIFYDACENKTDFSRWSLDDNILIIRSNLPLIDDFTVKIISINKNEMVFEESDVNFGVGHTTKYKKMN
ncbi:lipocalin family protein [Bacteroides sp. 224]|uniref:lipocalin family protein n=1 Tax=Bacteroides sp. 224 TaxID=2302936 RepID=UPI0013D8B176|nr:lipocalin family protein [Bacteroides sp. 224]NDV64882.1 hypothetical protein [Bacteroides sp. 224]